MTDAANTNTAPTPALSGSSTHPFILVADKNTTRILAFHLFDF